MVGRCTGLNRCCSRDRRDRLFGALLRDHLDHHVRRLSQIASVFQDQNLAGRLCAGDRRNRRMGDDGS